MKSGGSLGRTAALCLAFGASMHNAKAQEPLQPTRSFSSLCTEDNSGDVVGLRIKLYGASGVPDVTFEEPEGAVIAAVKAEHVAYSEADGRLAFTVPAESGAVGFEGRVSATELEGTLKREDGTRETIHLPKDPGGDGEAACAKPIKP